MVDFHLYKLSVQLVFVTLYWSKTITRSSRCSLNKAALGIRKRRGQELHLKHDDLCVCQVSEGTEGGRDNGSVHLDLRGEAE